MSHIFWLMFLCFGCVCTDLEGWFALSFGNQPIKRFIASEWRTKQKGKTAINYCDNAMLLLHGKWSSKVFFSSSFSIFDFRYSCNFYCHDVQFHSLPTFWISRLIKNKRITQAESHTLQIFSCQFLNDGFHIHNFTSVSSETSSLISCEKVFHFIYFQSLQRFWAAT